MIKTPKDLVSPRLFLKEVTREAKAYFMDLDSDPDVMRYLSNGVIPTPEKEEEAIERILKIYEKHHGRFGIWLAFKRDDGEFIGWFLFRPDKLDPENTKVIELGYRLKKKFWRQGYASEMSAVLLKHGFSTPEIESVFADTMGDNLGSQGVMKKIGMSFEKEFRHPEMTGQGDKLDVRFRITRQDYLSKFNGN